MPVRAQLCTFAACALLAAAAGGALASAPAPEGEAASFLFFVSSAGASYEQTGYSHDGRLTMTDPKSEAIAFTDRPERSARPVDTYEFLEYAFVDDPEGTSALAAALTTTILAGGVPREGARESRPVLLSTAARRAGRSRRSPRCQGGPPTGVQLRVEPPAHSSSSRDCISAVSYTHLTLPTKRIV